MCSSEVLLTYIKKLDHPMKEIRERSLQLLTAKLKLGWQLDDDFTCTRKLLESLLAWFEVQKPTLQHEALNLLLTAIKTKSGIYILKELGIRTVLSNLKEVKNKLEPEALGVFNDVIETLRFLNTVESEHDLIVPPLSLASSTSSENKLSFTSECNMAGKYLNQKDPIPKSNLDAKYSNNAHTTDCIKVLLFPWVELCPSDLKTITLMEDALKVMKSTKRCCRFICDVFLCDFPPEIFLNRPTIVNILVKIACGHQSGHPGEALLVLSCITSALRQRLLQLFSIELVHKKNKVSLELNECYDEVNAELEHIVGGCLSSAKTEDSLAVLRQIPGPIFALDTSYAVLTTMSRSVVLLDPNEYEALGMQQINICLNLIDSLISLLLDCVTDQFWIVEHSSKTHKDIAHKTCMLMRVLGELIANYKKSFLENTERDYHRIAWLRLICCGEKLLNWTKSSPLPPASLIIALQSAQLDPAVELLYPELSQRIDHCLLSSKLLLDQEHKTKREALKKLFFSMDHAIKLIKNQNDTKYSKEIITDIHNSLLILSMQHNESFLERIVTIVLYKSKDICCHEDDWTLLRSIALKLMAHDMNWVKIRFYQMLAEMVKSVLFGEEIYQSEHEQCLILLCDVSILTEICCHGLSSSIEEVSENASQVMVCLLRGRLVLSESCWWRLLASLLPILPLLHVYAAHDTQLGKAIRKSLESDIVECMGVSFSEMVGGLIRLLFVKCVAVQLEAAHALCRLLDDDRYLPPGESLRSDLLLNALRRLEAQDFNLDSSSSSVGSPQTAGLIQVLEVLKQDLTLDEDGKGYIAQNTRPTLEPSLRRSTLQQLSVLLRRQDSHEVFLQHDGINLIVSLLRLSLMVDDYLAFPECAISCVSVLNSVCFANRHNLVKISDLPLLLIRVILVFPSNDSCVLMSAQILSLMAWSGFVLQEINSSRQKVPALPLCVTERTSLPFPVNSYWKNSPNAEHCSLEWLQSDDEWRRAIRIRWWYTQSGGVRSIRSAFANLPTVPEPYLSSDDLALLRSACVLYTSTKGLLALENATSHTQVIQALALLQSYTSVVSLSCTSVKEYAGLPWHHVRRFLCAPPASSNDTVLLITLLQFIIAYMDNVPAERETMNWIKSFFIGNDVSVLSLLSRERLYPHQTPHEAVEVAQLQMHIIKIVWRCIRLLEIQDDYNVKRMESLLRILFSCLERIDVKNFHMLGYLNEVMRCIRYALNSRCCKLSEEMLLEGLKNLTRVLCGCGGGVGRKGQGCRLNVMLALIATLKHIHVDNIPVQTWSEAWSGEVLQVVVACVGSESPELRAAALHLMAALVHHAPLLPHLLQAIPNVSMGRYAMDIFVTCGEANVVRTSAAALLAASAARHSSHCDILEREIIEQIKETNFLDCCLQIFIEFCNEKKNQNFLQPNLPLSVLERRSELEVRAQKIGDVQLSPTAEIFQAPPTADLVVAVANVLYNVSIFKTCPVEAFNDQGLFRVIFRCASWNCGTVSERNLVRSATCRALSAAATTKCVRVTLAATKDCLVNLLRTLKQPEEGDGEEISAHTQTLLLLGVLLSDRTASDTIWNELRAKQALPFFFVLKHSLLSDDDEFQDAAMYCLTQLIKSTMCKKHADEDGFVDFFSGLKCDWQELDGSSGAGDTRKGEDCRPEYVCEELCKLLINRFQDLTDKKKCKASQEEAWVRVCSCLSSILSASARCRQYAAHRQLPRVLLATLHALRDQLSLQGKPVDVIRNANYDPILFTLYWVLTIINGVMLECPHIKEMFADNIAGSLNRLWPWCMMTEQLRNAIMHLLVTFTNDCPKAWACMCACVGGRNIISELCTLVGRSGGPLLLALRILCQCSAHHHCRAILLKSEVLSCMSRTCGRGTSWSEQSAAWARLCASLARHADGASALLVLPAFRPPHLRLLPALARAAHHQRAVFLHSQDLLELLSAALLAGSTTEVALAARAVWALAANNHRAKQVLRSAGVTSSVQSALQRYQRPSTVDGQQALQLLMYTCKVLQAT
ncbi:rotatin [Battus philenor]|uniref:rotatin n=1 Tax=Battus philenor TaxID=42288 RepID=UPI0035D0EA91